MVDFYSVYLVASNFLDDVVLIDLYLWITSLDNYNLWSKGLTLKNSPVNMCLSKKVVYPTKFGLLPTFN